jgi:phosphonopyruvate decarboxylase
MIEPKALFEALQLRGVGLFTGVPDSLLSNFCAYVDDYCPTGGHIITVNEGNAIALASGHYMATDKVSIVYMQNSGLGNTINPLTSLADSEVYRIPLLMLIGWRGEPGFKDEPQHVKQGRITEAQLDLLEIPFWFLEADSDVDTILAAVFAKLEEINAPVALLVRKDAFSTYKSQRKPAVSFPLPREEALRQILGLASPQDIVIATTGKTSREVFELRVERGEAQRDFLTVGGMGHTASIALGVALGQPGRRVLCLDGDGSVLMHMGALPIIGSIKPKNLIHILLNNAAHESVGGQPTVGDRVDFAAIAKGSGYEAYFLAEDNSSLERCWQQLGATEGPVLLEVKIRNGSRTDLGRPTSTPEQNKQAFMAHIRD